MNTTESAVKSGSVQYLTFMLGDEQFALDILSTREVLMMVRITPIPETPDYLAGVINLRGSVVPVLDLRKKFRMSGEAKQGMNSIIIAEITRNSEVLVVGALVDAVRGVLRVDRSMIDPPPKVGMKLNAELIEALARKDDGFVIVLNVEKIFSEEILESVSGRQPAADLSKNADQVNSGKKLDGFSPHL